MRGRGWLVERRASVPVAPLAGAAAVARCRAGETLLSAGFRNSSEVGGPHVVVDGMRRTGVRSLRVTGVNLSPRSIGRLTAYAYCGHAKRPLARSQTETVPPLGKVRLVARCPQKARGFGYRPQLFGGFAASSGPAAGAVVSIGQPAASATAGSSLPSTAAPMSCWRRPSSPIAARPLDR